jgi:hypothetical protein
MPDLKYLYRVLYILINGFFKQIVDMFSKAYYQESYILKYINISDSFHLKDLEISKYKRESKARMPITFCCLIFVNCGLFSFLNIIKVKI